MLYYFGGSKDGEPVTTPTGPNGEPVPIDEDMATAVIYQPTDDGRYERYDWFEGRRTYRFVGVVASPRDKPSRD